MHQSNYYDEGSTYGASDSENTNVDTEVTEITILFPQQVFFLARCLALSRQ
jgi:hypothetical protein